MGFWKTGDAQPKRNYRFQVQIGDDVWFWAKTCDTPSFDLGEVEVHYLDNKYYYPGRVSWNEINISTVDPAWDDVTSKLAQMLVDMGYAIKTEAASGAANNTTTGAEGKLGTISKLKSVTGDISNASSENGTTGTGALGTVAISVLAGDGNTVEKWTLNNAWLKSAKFGTLDYSNDELKQIDLVIRYDWATLTGQPAGAATTYFG